MTKYDQDQRIVMTLDAGGTNFVFSAVRSNKEIVDPAGFPSNAHDLGACLQTIKDGFSSVYKLLDVKPAAISFAFPGPSDFPAGIIGDLGNLPAFRGGVALGPMLEDMFGIPVFINNDGDLFAYGEAIAGLLPYVNQQLERSNSPKRYKNLFGVTLGTGFGGGIVNDGRLYLGDNSAGAEIWLLRNKLHTRCNVEEGASIRAVQRVYLEKAGLAGSDPPSPKEIYEIGVGTREGDREAARAAYSELGEAVGDALANAITLVDGLIVIGGGLAGAHSLFMTKIIEEMNGHLESISGNTIPRMEIKAFNLEDKNEFKKFLLGETKEITVPGSDTKILYDPMKRTGIGISRLGTSKAIAIGAYAYALSKLDRLE